MSNMLVFIESSGCLPYHCTCSMCPVFSRVRVANLLLFHFMGYFGCFMFFMCVCLFSLSCFYPWNIFFWFLLKSWCCWLLYWIHIYPGNFVEWGKKIEFSFRRPENLYTIKQKKIADLLRNKVDGAFFCYVSFPNSGRGLII